MSLKMWILAVCWLVLHTSARVRADEQVRYYEQNGVTYRETRRTERRPVTTTEWEAQSHTVYRDQYVTELRDAQRVIYTPVTSYLWEPRWHNWWNPFGQPYLAYHMRPVMQWQANYQTYRAPRTYRQVVPETQTVQVPRRSLQFEDHEVVERVAVAPTAHPLVAQPMSSSVRTSQGFGGVGRIENDPPRQGLVPFRPQNPVRR